MAGESAADAYRKLTAFMGAKDASYEHWYCGITNDVEERLHGFHRVAKTYKWWMTIRCSTSNDARQVEQWLLRSGCDGGTGGGDYESDIVYVYTMGSGTNP